MKSSAAVRELSPTPITIVRIPGAQGPILRCQGHLTVETAEVLRRDLMLLASAGHMRIIVNLNGVRKIDADGILALIEPARLHPNCPVMLVTSTEPALGYIHLTGVDRILRLFENEAEAISASLDPAS